jgi:hypothetical protein
MTPTPPLEVTVPASGTALQTYSPDEKPRAARVEPTAQPRPAAPGSTGGISKVIEDALRAAGLLR